MTRLFTLIALSILAAAAAAASPTPEPTATPELTATPESTATPEWTATPAPTDEPTAEPTPEPSPTPEPTGPPPPEPLEPEGGSRFGPDSEPIVFRWQELAEAAAYQIEIAIDPEFEVSSGPLECPGPEFDLGQFVEPDDWAPLAFPGFWRVAAVSQAGVAGAWSASLDFAKSSLAAPEVTGPTMGARMGPEDGPPKLEWSAVDGAAGYQLGFWADEQGLDFLGQMDWPAAELDLAELLTAEDWAPACFTLFWAVAAVEDLDVPSPWSLLERLSRSSRPSPELLQPADGVYLEGWSQPPWFAWNPVAGVVSYEIGFWGHPASGRPVVTMTMTDTGLDMGSLVGQGDWAAAWGTLAWGVSGLDEDGNYGAWSGPAVLSKLGPDNIMTWGDSITGGWGSIWFPDGGYGPILQERLRGIWGPQVRVDVQWVGGGQAWEGLWYLEEAMRLACPSQVLTMFGTVDMVDPAGCDPPGDCRTLEHLEAICDYVRAAGALPLLATLPPASPDGHAAGMDVEGYVNWRIRELGANHGIPVAEVYGDFMGYHGYLGDLFFDWLHPNDRGYEVMAGSWLAALVED